MKHIFSGMALFCLVLVVISYFYCSTWVFAVICISDILLGFAAIGFAIAENIKKEW